MFDPRDVQGMVETYDSEGNLTSREYRGQEEVFFSEREWDIMLSDPAFGYVCQNGHRLTGREVDGCGTCNWEAEMAWDPEMS